MSLKFILWKLRYSAQLASETASTRHAHDNNNNNNNNNNDNNNSNSLYSLTIQAIELNSITKW